jgi:hypothetical protein
MRLLDLDPRWYKLEEGGPRVGLTFECPHCRSTRLGVLFHHLGREALEDGYIRAYHGGSDEHIWSLSGSDELETLTLSPSIDASKSGHWHGFITDGVIR